MPVTDSALSAARSSDSEITAPVLEMVHFSPGDCALLIGPSTLLLQRLEAVRLIGLRPALLCTDEPDMGALPRGLRALTGEPAGVSGWMGRFTAFVKGRDHPLELAPLSFHEDGHFDWVLDFTGQPGAPVTPLGMYHLAPEDYPALKRALLEIAPRLREGFDKPRYFSFKEDLCAHRRQEIPGCAACLSVCPAQAISSEKENIRIEPHLCQGCGTCALACPSGAVRFAHPAPAASLARLNDALAGRMQAGSGPTGVWITDRNGPTEVPEDWLTYQVDETASLGLEFWLAALASGADRVAVAGGEVPAETRRVLAEQINVGRGILAGLGWPAALGLADSPAELDHLQGLPRPWVAPLPDGDDKRTLLFAAIDALARHGEAGTTALPLPGAPMGDVHIAAEKCTLCAACVCICPTGVLEHPGTNTQLAFTEQRCLQCGLCLNVCPEQAITLEPRLLVSATARTTPRVIAEGGMFNCTACGTPFAPRALVERSRTLMAGHPMFQGEQARLMELCPDCRQQTLAGRTL